MIHLHAWPGGASLRPRVPEPGRAAEGRTSPRTLRTAFALTWAGASGNAALSTHLYRGRSRRGNDRAEPGRERGLNSSGSGGGSAELSLAPAPPPRPALAEGDVTHVLNTLAASCLPQAASPASAVHLGRAGAGSGHAEPQGRPRQSPFVKLPLYH